MMLTVLCIVLAVPGIISSAPKSCKDVKACNSDYSDGEYWIYPDSTNNKPVKIYCKGMSTSNPTEYLTLHRHNYCHYPPHWRSSSDCLSYKYKPRSAYAGETEFHKVRVDITDMSVVDDDYSFITQHTGVHQKYGLAYACSVDYMDSCPLRGKAIVDVTETGLKVSTRTQWKAIGWHPVMKLVRRTPYLVEVAGDGGSGGCGPDGKIYFDYDEATIPPSCVATDPICCPAGWTAHGVSCYKYVPEALTFRDAESKCASLGGTLPTAKDQSEQNFIFSKGNSQALVLGLNDILSEGNFGWSDGTRATWKNWRTGEPNIAQSGEDCVALGEDQKWNDISCTIKLPTVCKMKPTFCFPEIKAAADGYYSESETRVPGNSQGECEEKCQSTTGCTSALYFYGKCELYFDLPSGNGAKVESCRQSCTSNNQCKTFRYSANKCSLYSRPFTLLTYKSGASTLGCK